MPPLPPVTRAARPSRLKIFDKGKYPFDHAGMRVDDVRRFNRFYTRRIGVLREGLLGSEFPLPEARLLYELGQRRQCTATELGADLDLDAGYLSRLLQSLRKRGFVAGKRSPDDARRSLLSLTAKGREAFSTLDCRSRGEVAGMLAKLPGVAQARLVEAMQTVERLLGEKGATPQIILRSHRPGDMGWVVAVRAGVRLGRTLRGARRRHRGEIRPGA
jgi:DNA-binding MarR family transcriptional regulator